MLWPFAYDLLASCGRLGAIPMNPNSRDLSKT
jgi:hypothetical protein